MGRIFQIGNSRNTTSAIWIGFLKSSHIYHWEFFGLHNYYVNAIFVTMSGCLHHITLQANDTSHKIDSHMVAIGKLVQ